MNLYWPIHEILHQADDRQVVVGLLDGLHRADRETQAVAGADQFVGADGCDDVTGSADFDQRLLGERGRLLVGEQVLGNAPDG